MYHLYPFYARFLTLCLVEVTLIDISEAAVAKGVGVIKGNLAKMVKKKKLSEENHRALTQPVRLSPPHRAHGSPH